MDVILLEKIENLGDLGDKVNVKPGFARNHLIPKAKAKYATEENLKEFEEKIFSADERLATLENRLFYRNLPPQSRRHRHPAHQNGEAPGGCWR